MTIGLILTLILLLNLYSYNLMRRDKQQAQRQGRRVPEKTLFLLAFFGGALGIYRAMNTHRHKTKHTSFRILIPLALLLNLALFAAIFYFAKQI